MARFLFLLFGFHYTIAQASNGDLPVGPRSAALGHTSVCLHDTWSACNNQGSLGYVRQAGCGAFYENRFLLRELSQSGFALALPIRKGSFGISYTALGYRLYKESQVKLGYGIALSEHISAGVAIDYLHVKLADVYGQTGSFTGEAGLCARVTKQLTFAAHVYNPFRAAVTSYNHEHIPTIMRLGLLYNFSERVFTTLEAEKTSLQKINVKAGLEYKPAHTIYLRFGCATSPMQAAFGFGVDYKGLKIDLSSMYHQVLGFSPNLGLSLSFGKHTDKPATPEDAP